MATRSRHASEETVTLPPEEPDEQAAPPIAVYVLLAINCAVYLGGLIKPGAVFDALALAPRSMRLYQLFSFGFLHFGLAHFATTAFVLALFGPKRSGPHAPTHACEVVLSTPRRPASE